MPTPPKFKVECQCFECKCNYQQSYLCAHVCIHVQKEIKK